MVRSLSIKNERKIIVIKNYSHIFGLTLTLLGLTPIIVVLSNAWASGVSFLDLPALSGFLWTNPFIVGFGIEFDSIYLIIAGVVMTLLGVPLLARKKERIEEVTLITEDVTVTLKCTNCGHRWKEHFSKTQLQSMGFPLNRTISRRKCLTCARFTRPKIISI